MTIPLLNARGLSLWAARRRSPRPWSVGWGRGGAVCATYRESSVAIFLPWLLVVIGLRSPRVATA